MPDDDNNDRLPPTELESYVLSYWKNGWRRHPGNDSPDLLCLRTGRYGLTLDTANLTRVGYGTLDRCVAYTDAVVAGDDGEDDADGRLDDVDLLIQVTVSGRTYVAKRSKSQQIPTGPVLGDEPTKPAHARTWEAGRNVSHYELPWLVFEAEGGANELAAFDASLHMVVWPDGFSLTLDLNPKGRPCTDAVAVKMVCGDWSTEESLTVGGDAPSSWPVGTAKSVALSCAVTEFGTKSNATDGINVSCRNNSYPDESYDVAWSDRCHCLVANVKKPTRPWMPARPYPRRNITDHDAFVLTVTNDSDDADGEGGDGGRMGRYVPFLLDLEPAANITGLCPFLTEEDGRTPTAVPVQLSKNWHDVSLGEYFKGYVLLPCPAKRTVTYHLRIQYGCYGEGGEGEEKQNLCVASHADLALVGWGKKGPYHVCAKWDQLAVGCYGETFCLDMEMGCVENTITDVRALMVRNGKDGVKWDWTDVGWGGDYLAVWNDEGRRMHTVGVKTAVVSPGPCLTDVRHGGYYGARSGGREVTFASTIRTARADDFCRTFINLKYKFNGAVAFRNITGTDGSCLFRLGGAASANFGWTSPRVMFGNRDGPLDGGGVGGRFPPFADSGAKAGDFLLERFPLTGPGPWWIAFPGSFFTKHKAPQFGFGWKGLIIRHFEASFAGEAVINPSVSLYVRKVYEDGQPYLDALLTPPEGVETIDAGDSIQMDVEWVTFPHNAVDYYGPNEAFRSHLETNEDSWRTIHREVVGNDLEVTVDGGEVEGRYPVVVRTTQSDNIKVQIKGGVGAVPIEFLGLKSNNYGLFGDLSGEDGKVPEWQTSYEAKGDGGYSMTFNLPLDGVDTSTWVLKET